MLVGGAPARKRHVLRAGEEVLWQAPPPPAATLAAEDVPYEIVYEDEWLLVVDKPAGVVVHPAPGHEHGTLAQGLVAEGARGGHELRPGIVHRLDKDTSGLLIVARRDEAYRRLVAAMERRDIHRVYLALLAGDLPQDDGTIDAPIGRHIRDRKRMSLHTVAGRPAVTHFDVLGRAPGYTLTRVTAGDGPDPSDQGALLGARVSGRRRRAVRAGATAGGPGATVPARRSARLSASRGRAGDRLLEPASARACDVPRAARPPGAATRLTRRPGAFPGLAAAAPVCRCRPPREALGDLAAARAGCYSTSRPLIHVLRDGKGVQRCRTPSGAGGATFYA